MHEYLKELLIKYHDGICTEEESKIIKEHLKGCNECKKALMEMDYEIFYESEKEQKEEVPVSKKDIRWSKIEKTDVGGKKKEAKSNEKNAAPFQRIMKNVGIGVIVIVICVIYFNINKNMLSDMSEEYMVFYYDSEVIPEGIISASGVVNSVKLNQHKQDVYDKMLDYYVEENEDLQTNYKFVVDYLNAQSKGERALLDREVNIDEVEVAWISLGKAKVYVYISYGSESFTYVINYKRAGLKWKIETVEECS